MKRRMILLCGICLLCIAALCGCGRTVPPEEGTVPTVDTETPKLEIIAPDRTTKYYIIRGERATDAEAKAAVALRAYLRDTLGIETVISDDWEQNENRSDYEILVGKTVREKAETFLPDRELLGKDGYVIRTAGTKVFLCGGSDSATAAAVQAFISMIPGEGAFTLQDGFTYTHSPKAVYQGVKVDKERVPLSEFCLSFDADDAYAAAAESHIRSLFFEKCGTYLAAAGGAEAGDASPANGGTAAAGVSAAEKSAAPRKLILTTKDPDVPADGFRVGITAEGNVILCASPRVGLYRGVRDLFEEIEKGTLAVQKDADGALLWAGDFGYEKHYGTFVTYEDYGAKGDGKTNDVPALKQAHAEANQKKLPVLANETAVYYIDGKADIINITTDTDWSIAHFIIDDRQVEKVGTEVFRISSSYAAENLDLKTLKKGQKNIGLKFDGPVLVAAVNANVKQYIRYGGNQDNGQSMSDVFLVDKDGNVDPSTPILWDFDAITSVNVRRIDTEPLYLKGGYIETVANADKGTSYYYRGIRVYRSNVIADGLTHTVSGEGAEGAPYYGILIYNYTVDCIARNVTFTGHKTYKKTGSTGSTVSAGTYDITVTNSMGFLAENCCQTNDINDGTYWGVFASNTSKNITFDGCSFSRFDAHRGVCNVTLLNCELGHQGINLIGHGTARIENTTVYSQYFVNLRNDYGSTWEGDLIIRNCTYVPKNGAKCDPILINGTNTDTHDFGYTCYLPENITIDGLNVVDTNRSSQVPVYLFANFNKNWTSDSYVPKYAMVMPKNITVSGLTTVSGLPLEVSENKFFFKGVEIASR